MYKKVINMVLLIIFTFIYNVGAITITSTYCEKMGETNYIVKCCCCEHDNSHTSCCDTKITIDQKEYESTTPSIFSFNNYYTVSLNTNIDVVIIKKVISIISPNLSPPLNSGNPPFLTPIRI